MDTKEMLRDDWETREQLFYEQLRSVRKTSENLPASDEAKKWVDHILNLVEIQTKNFLIYEVNRAPYEREAYLS